MNLIKILTYSVSKKQSRSENLFGSGAEFLEGFFDFIQYIDEVFEAELKGVDVDHPRSFFGGGFG